MLGKLNVMDAVYKLQTFLVSRVLYFHIFYRTAYVKITLVFKTFLPLNSEKTRLVKIMILTGCKLNSFVAPYF